MNADYADENYQFLRNKKGDNISKKLFTEKRNDGDRQKTGKQD